MELSNLFRHMARARAFEVAVEALWDQGLISGEMHLGTGEEAIATGVVTHLGEGDGLSLTHRCSPALVVRGVSLVAMLHELLGHEEGLCGGRGGHMHLMSREHLAASSGIVGASMPLGAGFALAAQKLRPGAVGCTFVGAGAMDQGMALETLNLSRSWHLPQLIVCIDNGWAITTPTGAATGGELTDRARAFGLPVERIQGIDVEEVHKVSGALLERVRQGKGPAFLHATCPRLDGHYLGDPLLHQVRKPTGTEAKRTLSNVLSAVTSPGGGGVLARAGSMVSMVGTMARARLVPRRDASGDPMHHARKAMERQGDGSAIEEAAKQEVKLAVEQALEGGAHG
jgi:pyruvate dehydrogenase E1 component alpha subunit